MAVTEAHLRFKGHVQGVGFRYTAQRIARECRVNGWVKNCADGDVEVLIQADEETIEKFLTKIRSVFSRYIIDEEREDSAAAQLLDSFEIRF